MTTITAVKDKSLVRSAEFVKLTIKEVGEPDKVYTFSSAYRAETIAGQKYSPLGGLLGIGEQHRDLRVTSFETTISLTGVDPAAFQTENIYLVLAEQIRGSEVEILRGFYNENYQLSSSVSRFKGIITGYSVSEQREGDVDMFNIVLNCSSYKAVLENNASGRRTNSTSWGAYDPTDSSMDNIEALAGAYFNFGGPVTAKAGEQNGGSVQDPNDIREAG